MPKYRHLFLFIVTVVVLFAGLYFFKQTQIKGAIQKQPEEVIASEQKLVVSYNCEQGKSVFDVLKNKETVESSDGSFGKFVSGINGVSQGNGKYWLYSVDGQEATVGASDYICKGGENITWELK